MFTRDNFIFYLWEVTTTFFSGKARIEKNEYDDTFTDIIWRQAINLPPYGPITAALIWILGLSLHLFYHTQI